MMISGLFATYWKRAGSTNRETSSAPTTSPKPESTETTIGTIDGIVQVRLDREHHDRQDVLHQQDAQRQAAVHRVKLALVREQLDHDHRARERRGDPQVERRQAAEAEQQHEADRQHGAGDDLQRADQRADPPELTSFFRSISRPTMNIKNARPSSDSSAIVSSLWTSPSTGRADQQAGADVGEQQRLTQQARHVRERRRRDDREADVEENAVMHACPPSRSAAGRAVAQLAAVVDDAQHQQLGLAPHDGRRSSARRRQRDPAAISGVAPHQALGRAMADQLDPDQVAVGRLP